MKTMTQVHKTSRRASFVALAMLGLVTLSCSDDDDDNPVVVDEEEVITTMTVNLMAADSNVRLTSTDLDGDGPNAPEITVVGTLAPNSTYTGSITLLNETTDPVEDVTEEIEEEDDEHQFFFATEGAITGVTSTDADGDGNPIGLAFELTTGDAGTGTLRVTLRHEPKKPNNGTLADAGGETDISQQFTVTVE